MGRWDENARLASQAYDAVYRLNDWNKAGSRAYNVAWTEYIRGHTEDAAVWADRCAEMYVRGQNKNGQGIAIRMRGLVARQRQDYNIERQSYRDALIVFRDLKNDEWIGILINDLGTFEHDRKKYDAAEQYYQEALEIATKQDDKEGQAIYAGNLGAVTLARRQWSNSRRFYEQVLALVQEVGRQDEIARIKRGLARVHEEEGHADLALPLVKGALEIYQRLHHKDLEVVQKWVERLEKKIKAEE